MWGAPAPPGPAPAPAADAATAWNRSSAPTYGGAVKKTKMIKEAENIIVVLRLPQYEVLLFVLRYTANLQCGGARHFLSSSGMPRADSGWFRLVYKSGLSLT